MYSNTADPMCNCAPVGTPRPFGRVAAAELVAPPERGGGAASVAGLEVDDDCATAASELEPKFGAVAVEAVVPTVVVVGARGADEEGVKVGGVVEAPGVPAAFAPGVGVVRSARAGTGLGSAAEATLGWEFAQASKKKGIKDTKTSGGRGHTVERLA